MSAATFFTWDGDEDNDPRRPSTDDLGGDQKEDDAEYPPDDVTMPTAAAWNEQVRQIAGLAKMVPAVQLDVDFTAGAPAIVAVNSPSTSVVVASFDVTDEGTGVVLIEWDSALMPPAAVYPRGLTIRSALTTRLEGHIEPVTNGVRVFLFSNGTAADLDFSLDIHGA